MKYSINIVNTKAATISCAIRFKLLVDLSRSAHLHALCAIFLCVSIGGPLIGQGEFTNLNYNFEIRTVSGTITSGENGLEEPRFLWAACPDVGGPLVSIMNGVSDGTVNNPTTCGTTIHCLQFQADCGSGCTISMDQLVRNASDIDDPYYDLEMRMWENDGGDQCIFDSDDDEEGIVLFRANATSLVQSPSLWSNTQTHLATNGGNMQYKVAWRYAEGTRDNPIDFGIIDIGPGTFLSNNSNRGAPAGAQDNTGYDNDWEVNTTANSGNDVTYQFTIEDSPKLVAISTDNPNLTNFDTYLYLFDESEALLAENNNFGGSERSRFDAFLCPGTYTVVVEGVGGETGDFILFVGAFTTTLDGGQVEIANLTGGSTPTGVCEGASFDIVLEENTPAGQVLGGLSPTYAWQRKLMSDNVWTTVGTDQASVNLTNQAMGDEAIQYRRTVTYCGNANISDNVASSNVIEIQSIDNQIDGGQIKLDLPPGISDNFFIRQGSPSLLSVINEVTPTGDPGPLTYQWVKMSTSHEDSVDGSFQSLSANTITMMTNNGMGMSEEEDFTLHRLSTNACFAVDQSNALEFDVIDPRGEINGRVAAPNGGSPIRGVEVCAVLDESFGHVVDRLYAFSKCDTTDAFGDYSIEDLYTGDPSGDGIRYNVMASFLDHDLRKPPANVTAAGGDSIYIVDLRDNGISFGNDYDDLTAISIQGNVFHDFMGTEYGKAGVVVHAERLIQGVVVPVDSSATDELGNYSLALPSPGEYRIRPEFEMIVVLPNGEEPVILEHEFSPANVTQVFINNTADVDFEDESLQKIVIGYGGACDRDIGIARINLIDRDNGNGILMNHDIVNSMQELFVPARDYDIDILGDQSQPEDVTNGADANLVLNQLSNLPNDSAIVSFFVDTVFIEVQEAPRVALNGLDALIDDSCGPGTPLHNLPILQQHVRYPDIAVEIFEGPMACPLDTGMFQMAVGTQNLPTLPISDGEAVGFLLQGSFPNFNDDHTLMMTLNAIDAFNQPSNEISQTFVTTGAQSNGTDFLSLSPELPILVLHDPPTDGGAAFWESETEYNFTSTTFLNRSEGGGAYTALQAGGEFENGVSIFGITFSSETEAFVTGEVDFSTAINNNSSTSTSVSTRVNQAISTSDDESLIGDDADVVMTMISAKTFSESDILAQDGCELETFTDFAISRDSVAALSLRTIRDIKEIIIPDLESAIELEDDEGVRNGLKFSIQQWRDIITSNEEEKRRAFIDNPSDSLMHIAIGSGVNFESSISRDSTYSSSFEYFQEVDMQTAVGARLIVAGNGGEGNVFVQTRHEISLEPSTDEEDTQSITTGYSLLEDDQGDQLLIAIYEDSRYGTPIFNVIGGSSSCPYVEYNEEDPVSRTNLYSILADDPLIVNNVTQSGSINRRFTIFNNSNSDIGFNIIRDFAFGQTSQVRINGSLDNLVNLTVGANSNVQIFVNIRKVDPGVGPANENVRIRIAPDCGGEFEDNNEESLTYTVNYISDVSPVTIARPLPNEIVNISSNNKLTIRMTDYDISKFDDLGLQFTQQGAGSLMDDTDFSFPSSDFNPNPVVGTFEEWDLSQIQEDGIYEIKLITTMDGSTISNGSDLVTVVVDRQKPIVFGVPEPVDDHYDQSDNDILSVSYNEVIRASSTGLMVEIENLVTGEIIPAQATIFQNRIRIVESTALNSLAPSAYRVTLSGIEDLVGNPADTYRWVFLVGDFFEENLACLYDLVISNNNFDQNAINATSYRARFISSDGLVNDFGTTTYTAEVDIDLEPGFEVSGGGVFIADIETCVDE